MMTTSSSVTVAATRPGWRFWVALGAWTGVVVGFALGLMTFWQLVGMSLGQALGGSGPSPDELFSVWSTFVVIIIGLVVAAVAAIIARRWVALVLAVIIAGGCALFAIGLAPRIESVVAPVEHVDEGPPPCACYSGSVCECPGG
jgi:hypothetical protein